MAMQTKVVDRRALSQAGVAALQRGDARGARQAFEAALASGTPDANLHVGLAYACRDAGDAAASLAAIDAALALEPRHLRALVLKGDHFAAAGDDRAAASFYAAAAKAAPDPQALPPDLRAEIARAQAACERYASEFEGFLRERIGALEGAESRRFAQSLDLLVGKKRIYVQQPRYYYFPGLAAIPFHERRDFPFLDALEAATPRIRAELLEVMQQEAAAFQPYVQGDPRRPRREQDGMLDNPAWSAFYLWKDGELVAENAARCPATLEALRGVPLAQVPNRSPSVLFSLLRPGARIPPHTGMVNTRLICHLPLVVPEGCRFRVGNEERDWREGEAWVFDDTIEHEAWNRSDHTRVILLFEIWRPELTPRERELVCAMFAAIDAHAGEKPAWEI